MCIHWLDTFMYNEQSHCLKHRQNAVNIHLIHVTIHKLPTVEYIVESQVHVIQLLGRYRKMSLWIGRSYVESAIFTLTFRTRSSSDE